MDKKKFEKCEGLGHVVAAVLSPACLPAWKHLILIESIGWLRNSILQKSENTIFWRNYFLFRKTSFNIAKFSWKSWNFVKILQTKKLNIELYFLNFFTCNILQFSFETSAFSISGKLHLFGQFSIYRNLTGKYNVR